MRSRRLSSAALFGCAGLSGLLCQLAAPPVGFAPLVFVAFVPALLWLPGERVRVWAAAGFVAGVCMFAGAPLALVAWSWELYLGLWMCVGLLFAAFFAAAGLLYTRLAETWRWLAWPAAWMLGTFLAERILELPLALSPAFGFAHPDWLGASRIIGLPGMEFLIALPSALCVELLRGRISGARFAATAALLAGVLAAGRSLCLPEPTGSLTVHAVQPSISIGDAWGAHWSLATRSRVEKRLDELSARAVADGPSLVVWPEGGNDGLNRRLLRRRERVLDLLGTTRSELLITGKDLTPEGELYSVVTHVTRAGFGADARKARPVHFAERDLAAGRPSVLVTGFGRVGIAICFEAIFGEHQSALVRQGAEVVGMVTDDSSFGPAPLQHWHIAFALTRAIEVGRALFVVGNRGISLATDLRGRIQSADWSGREPSVRRFELASATGLTPAVRGGRQLSLLAVVAALLLARRRTPSSDVAAPRSIRTVLPLACAGATLGLALSVAISARAHGLSALGVARARVAGTGAADGVAPAFRQSGERSCGAAALAYLLTRLGDLAFEEDIGRVLQPGSEIGYSLAELARIARERGFAAQGFEGAFTDLPAPGRPPVLAHLRRGHYVVVLEAVPGWVTYFDPARGETMRAPRGEFMEEWSGYFVVVSTLPESELRAH
jgi:apolipoprotein N-acyltransferase